MANSISKTNTLKKSKSKTSEQAFKNAIDRSFNLTIDFPNKNHHLKTLKEAKYFEYLNLRDLDYEKNLPILWRIYLDNIRCLKSESPKCTNENGFHLHAVFKNDSIFVENKICPKYEKILKENSFKKNYLWRSFDETWLNLKFNKKNIDSEFNNHSRTTILNHMNRLISQKNNDGFYLYGTTGVGKSYLTTLMCNSLARKNQTISYAFLPDVVSKFMAKFGSNLSVESEVDKLIKADVLVLDDIGSETIREWFFNEYLLRILNYRDDHKKTTIFISNYSLPELERYYSNKKTGVNLKATKRIIDRILGLSKSHIYELKGESWRTKKVLNT